MFAQSDREAALTLFCLPYAGGSAAIYREWARRVPAWLKLVPLHMPGRGTRHGMRAMHQWPELLDLLIDDMQPHLQRPFAIFGHSMGALIGFELAHALRARLGRSPVWLGVSACKAPSRRARELHWLTCPDAEFLDEVRSLKGMPDELLANREFMELVLPFLRADFHLCGSYDYRQRPPLQCPVLAIGGTQDEALVGDARNLLAWQAESSGPFRLESLDAGHFFINTHRDALIELVVGSLARVLRHGERFDDALRRSYA